LRSRFSFLKERNQPIIIAREEVEVRWFTFAGGIINTALADTLRRAGFDDVKATDFCITMSGTTDANRVRETIETSSAAETRDGFHIVKEYVENLKFNECLPTLLSQVILRERLIDWMELCEVLNNRVVILEV